MHIYAHTHTHTHIHTYIHTYIHVYVFTHTHTHTYQKIISTYTHIYIYIYCTYFIFFKSCTYTMYHYVCDYLDICIASTHSVRNPTRTIELPYIMYIIIHHTRVSRRVYVPLRPLGASPTYVHIVLGVIHYTSMSICK